MNPIPSPGPSAAQMLFGFAVAAALLGLRRVRRVRPAVRAVPAVHLPAHRDARRSAWSACWRRCTTRAARGGRIAWGLLAFLAAGIGAAIAGRHVWLQHLPPDQVPACGPSLDYMLESMPSWLDVVKKVLRARANAPKVDWTFLGLSMPEWTLLCFVLLAARRAGRGFQAPTSRRSAVRQPCHDGLPHALQNPSHESTSTDRPLQTVSVPEGWSPASWRALRRQRSSRPIRMRPRSPACSTSCACCRRW